MNSVINRVYCGLPLYFEFNDGVIKTDYYKDYLVEQLSYVMGEFLKKKHKNLKVLDIATGHGYTTTIMAKYYEAHIKKIVAYDINPQAVELAKRNAQRNNCNMKIIDFRIGSIFEPLKEKEKFDIILAALPPVPITRKELQNMPDDIRSHHWISSTAGATGRELLDRMIQGAFKKLNHGGIVLTVQADFQDSTKKTLEVMKNYGLNGELIGKIKSRKLKETRLTFLRREAIMNLGYRFTKDKYGDEQFYIVVYRGKKSHKPLLYD